jgi:hypothetical protein
LLYAGDTSLVPIEGVYGAIEVKSRLSKSEVLSAARSLRQLKTFPREELVVHRLGGVETYGRRTTPFGVVIGFQLANNSLDSLAANITEFENESDVPLAVNMVIVMGRGMIVVEGISKANQERHIFLTLEDLAQFQEDLTEQGTEVHIEYSFEVLEFGGLAFGRFFTYLTALLTRANLGKPDLANYMSMAENRVFFARDRHE